MQIKGSQQLEAEVLGKGICTLCGGCIGLCPYYIGYEGRVVVMDSCNRDTGRCYAFCPRTCLDLDIISNILFGVPYPTNELGMVQEIMMTRATDPEIRSRAQYGGTVSCLVCLALSEGLVGSAVLTRSNNMLPAGTIARSKEEVLECAGSNYVASSTLEVLNSVPKQDTRGICVVGTPCQVLTLGKMKAVAPEYESNANKVEMIIGLFCTWALSYRDFVSFLQKEMSIHEVKKFDVPPPPANSFEVHTTSGLKTFSLDLIRSFVRPACTYCLDMTSEFADISVGAVEGVSGWNTVIARTHRGSEFLNMAQAKGVIETAPLPIENLEHLKEASLLKKKRALENIVRRTGSIGDLLYLTLPKETVANFLHTGE